MCKSSELKSSLGSWTELLRVEDGVEIGAANQFVDEDKLSGGGRDGAEESLRLGDDC